MAGTPTSNGDASQSDFDRRLEEMTAHSDKQLRDEVEGRVRSLRALPRNKVRTLVEASDDPELSKSFPELLETLQQHYGEELLEDSYECRLLDVFEYLREGTSFSEAAERVGFTSRDPEQCPPAKKARIVLRSFLERHGQGRLMELFEQYQPEFSAELEVDASWLEEAQESGNFRGKCWKMSSECSDIVRVMRDLDTGNLVGAVLVKGRGRQQEALRKALSALQHGELQVLNGPKAQATGLKVEPTKHRDQYLVCLHCQTDGRIWGIYNSKTGELTWRGYVDKHEKWSNFLANGKL